MTRPLENIFERASRLSAAGQRAAIREIKKILARIEAEEHAGQEPESALSDYEPFPVRKRVAGLGKGTIQMAPDFDDPLPDSYWLSDE